MQLIQSGKFLALSLVLAVAAGCSSTSGDEDGSAQADPNAAYGAGNGSGVNGGLYGSGGAGGAGGAGGSGGYDDASMRTITVFYFDYDSADLTPESMRALDAHARDLKASGQHIVLEGFTDERGTREYNMALGERRAQAVQRYLVMQGLPVTQMELVSYGEERPAAAGQDEQSWAQNRRVQMRVSGS